MNIIVEGCDCTGKSTFVDLLVERHEYKKIKLSAPEGKTQEEQMKNAKETYHKFLGILNNKDHYVFDRFYLGELIYAPIIRGYTPTYIREFEKKINYNNILIIFTARDDIILKRFDNKFITKEQIPLINNAYCIQYKESLIKDKMIIDTSNLNPEEVYDRIMLFIKDVEHELYSR